jgi:hypothetical protein
MKNPRNYVHKISIYIAKCVYPSVLFCPGFVVSRVCPVQGLSCPGFVLSRVCPVQGLSCPGFVLSRVCLSRVCRCIWLSSLGWVFVLFYYNPQGVLKYLILLVFNSRKSFHYVTYSTVYSIIYSINPNVQYVKYLYILYYSMSRSFDFSYFTHVFCLSV